MKHYKITDAKGQTKNETQWGENVTHEITKGGNTLCSDEVFHGYKSPEMAVFMNPSHGDYDEKTMLLWECKGVKVAGDGTKLGFKKQTTIKRIDKPVITTEQRIEIAIRCAMKVSNDRLWRKWGRNWINGTDRTHTAANAANAAYGDYAAADAANAAYAAAYTAAYAAAYAAAHADKKVNIARIIKNVMEDTK